MKRTETKCLKCIGETGVKLGEARILIPFTALRIIIDVDFRSLMRRNLLVVKQGCGNERITHLRPRHYLHIGNRCQLLAWESYFFTYRWSAADTPYSMYNANDLRRIHRVCGHLSVRVTNLLLQKEIVEKLENGIKNSSVEKQDRCRTSQESERPLRRFKLTIGSKQVTFNYRVIVDTMFILSRAELHMADKSTRITDTEFLKN